MSYDFNADDILQTAEQIEKNGALFYRASAEKVTDSAAKEILLGLGCLDGAQLGPWCHAGEHGLDAPGRADAGGVQPIKCDALFVERIQLRCKVLAAETADGVVMGIRHRDYVVEGVQFHPESIMTEVGHDVLKNFLSFNRSRWQRGEDL